MIVTWFSPAPSVIKRTLPTEYASPVARNEPVLPSRRSKWTNPSSPMAVTFASVPVCPSSAVTFLHRASSFLAARVQPIDQSDKTHLLSRHGLINPRGQLLPFRHFAIGHRKPKQRWFRLAALVILVHDPVQIETA